MGEEENGLRVGAAPARPVRGMQLSDLADPFDGSAGRTPWDGAAEFICALELKVVEVLRGRGVPTDVPWPLVEREASRAREELLGGWHREFFDHLRERVLTFEPMLNCLN